MRKKIVYYDWDSLMQRDMLTSLKEMGFEVVLTTQRMQNFYCDDAFAEYLSALLRTQAPDYCFSFNFFPLVADICQREGVRYVSWVFDSPLLNLYSRSVFHSCNRIYHFDRGASERVRQAGAQIYHLPLAARADKWTSLPLRGKKLPTKELTFVGRIYDKKNYYDQIRFLPEHLKGYLEGLMEAQRKVWGYNFLEECINRNGIEEICKYVKMECPDSFFYTPGFVFANLFMNQKVTALEREEALHLLTEVMDVALYSDSLPDSLKGNPRLHYEGTVDSDTEAPCVFHTSRINLNLTVRSILTGIPLRIFDIAASEGMVLSNYQEEIPECFEPDKEIVLFASPEEMVDKASYYARHEKECIQIARAGRERLCREHTLERRIKVMFAE